jgi:hypothetical protein
MSFLQYFEFQNVLGVVDSDLTFQFAVTGWVGTTCDGKFLRGALTKEFRPTTIWVEVVMLSNLIV